MDNDPDASMNPIVFNQAQDPAPSVNHLGGSQAIDSLLSQVINLNNEQMLHEPTCLICSSPLRKEAEEAWDSNQSQPKAVVKIFEEKSSTTISQDVVTNHMKYHKDRAVKELQKVEYVDRIKRLSNGQMTTLDRIEMCLSILTERLMAINSLVPCGDKSQADIDKLKSSETDRLMKTFGTFLKLQAQIQGELKEKGEVISIPKGRFIDVFQNTILNAQNDREREIIRTIMNGLKGIEN